MATLKNLTISDTGSVQLPSGTTAQRGAAGESVVTFSTVGTTSWTCPAGITSIRVLIVGGGGGGGGDVGGGGGGGGVIYYANYAVTPGNGYAVVVGAGGSGGANTPGQGGNSSFNSVIAYGGGGGGYWSNGAPVGNPSTMGSGGGQTSNYSGAVHTPTTGQGYPGGKGGYNTANSFEYSGASGGGGAGQQGGAGVYYDVDRAFEGTSRQGGYYEWASANGANSGWSAGSTQWGYGGDGLAFDISGTPTFYAGGGGSSSDGGSYWGVGGKGGGGNGGNSPAATSYGGGGGGAGTPTGGAGYQGVVIIAYNSVPGEMRYNTTTALPESLAGNWDTLARSVSSSGGSVTTSGGYTIRTFTTSGTLTLNTPGTVEVLLVAGGGGGGTIGGGGGGGGYLYQSNVKLNAGAYPVVVGTGGAGATSHSNNTQFPGTNSKFHTLEAFRNFFNLKSICDRNSLK